MLVYDGTLYCLLNNGAVVGYKDSTGEPKTVTVSNHMKAQMARWAGKGISFINNILHIWQGTNKRTYEFVPLGVFSADRPDVPTVIEIRMTCHDLMQRFEKDLPSDADLGITYPITFGSLFIKLCQYVGVQYRSSIFINSTAQITKRLDDFDTASMRDVIQWLAEAAGSVARFDREGYLIMDWIRTTQYVIDEHGYKEFNPYWYATKKVTKLYNRGTNGEYDNTVGTGNEADLIQDNPLLRGVN